MNHFNVNISCSFCFCATDVLDILCLDHFYFAGVWRIILFSRIPHTHTHTHKSLLARTRTHKSLLALTRTRPSRVVPHRTLLHWVPRYSRGSAALYFRGDEFRDTILPHFTVLMLQKLNILLFYTILHNVYIIIILYNNIYSLLLKVFFFTN